MNDAPHAKPLPQMTQTTQTAKYNRMLFYILLAHLPVVMFIVPIGYGTQGFTVPAGLLLGVAIVASFVLLRTSVAYSIFAGVLLMALSATMIQAQLGRIEMHFHIFGALALLLIFRDWRPIVVAAATIAIHHLALTWAQLEGVSFAGQPLMVFSYGCSWGIAMLHATFVVFESSALVYYAVAMQREERVAQQLTDAVLQAHEQNDLGVRIEDHNSSVATSFNLLMESFSQLTQQLSASSDTLRQEAEQMNGSVAEAQQEIRSQHVQTEHMASAIAQMTSSIHSVAESTQQAADSAQTSNQKAEEGVELFNEAQAAMRMLQDSMQAASGMIGHLEEDAENIGQVVDVISMISQQTNLLALNAAIEAARAGDHGRGFAVVAEEVRSLAQRTKASTDEIQRIISKLQSDTKEAVVSISQGESKTQETSARLSVAGTNLSDILSASSDILQLNLQIAEASSEQSQTASVINQNVATISASSDNIVRHSADNLKIAEHVAGVSRTIGERVAAYQH